MKRLVEARALCTGDVVVTSSEQRMRIAEQQLCGDHVGLRLQTIGADGRYDRQAHPPFFVMTTTRFMRES